MLIRTVIQVAALVVFMVSAMKSTPIQMDVVARVNERLPGDRKFTIWNSAGARRAFGELFPGDPLLTRLKMWRRVGFASWGVFFVCLLWR